MARILKEEKADRAAKIPNLLLLEIPRPSCCRTQIDLLKPLLGAERRVDALGHYHERTSQTSHPAGPCVGRIQLEFLTGTFFSHSLQYPSIIILISEIITKHSEINMVERVWSHQRRLCYAATVRTAPSELGELSV